MKKITSVGGFSIKQEFHVWFSDWINWKKPIEELKKIVSTERQKINPNLYPAKTNLDHGYTNTA